MSNYLLVGGLVLVCACVRGATVAEWSFNGSDVASVGNGTARIIGGVSVSYAAGSPADPATNNTAWNTASFPTQGTGNKSAGVEFKASTEGYRDLSVSWDQRLSGTASKYLRGQYSTDGVTFMDLPEGVVVSSRTLTFEGKMLSFSGVAGVEDNPMFAFRIVSEFEASAVGSSVEEYVTTYGTNAYSRSGTVRFDLVTLSGTLQEGADTPPLISGLADQSLRIGQVSAPLQFTVSDLQDAAEDLLVTAATSDPAVISEVTLAGGGTQRQVSIKAGNVEGIARVSLTVLDSGGRSSSTDFGVTVLPSNTAPMISVIVGTNLICGSGIEPIWFVIGDEESSADTLSVTGTSANPMLVPGDEAHLIFSGSGSNRAVRVIPVAGQVGVAPITVKVSDGLSEASSSFAVMVRPSESMLLYEPFTYAEGSVCSNSGFLWRNRSGAEGDCQARAGQLELRGSGTEDVVAALAGAPYVRSNATVLYASFRFKFLGAPRTTPEYFAHFSSGGALRGRVFAGAVDLWPGAFRLYVANGSETNRALPWNLSTNTSYTVVTRYDVDSAQTTAWLNPVAESDPGTPATDPQPAVSISSFGFRQDSGLGTTLLVDDLKVGLSFASVTEAWMGTGLRLGIEAGDGEVVLRWANAAAVLQAGDSAQGAFLDVPDATSPLTNVIHGRARFFRLRE